MFPDKAAIVQADGLDPEDFCHLLSSFLENSYDAIVITSGEVDQHRILYANPRFCTMTGYRLDELVGKKPSILSGPLTSKRVIERLRQSLQEGKPFRGATTNYRKDGTAYPVEWNIQPIFADGGEIKYFLSIQRNLSSLKQSLSRLKSSNNHFRRFLNDLRQTQAERLEADQVLSQQHQAITAEMMDNATLFTSALRSDAAVELFDETEFFDFSEGDQGVMPDVDGRPRLSAADLAASVRISDQDLGNMRSIITDIENALSLIDPDTIDGDEFSRVVKDLHELAAAIFFIEEFTDISTVLGELSVRLERADGATLPGFTLGIFSALMADLNDWIESVFVSRVAEDVHYLDASIISSAKQMLQFLPAA